MCLIERTCYTKWMGTGLVHVDLVHNDWGSRRQFRIACVEADGQSVRATHFSDRGQELLQRIVDARNDVTTGVTDLEPEQAFSLLRSTFHNTYFFTTEPHEEAACGFTAGDEITMLSDV